MKRPYILAAVLVLGWCAGYLVASVLEFLVKASALLNQ